MDPELEALLKSFDRFMEARGGSDEQQLFAVYRSRLDEVAAARRINNETLDSAVRKKYSQWLKANARPSTIPPKA